MCNQPNPVKEPIPSPLSIGPSQAQAPPSEPVHIPSTPPQPVNPYLRYINPYTQMGARGEVGPDDQGVCSAVLDLEEELRGDSNENMCPYCIDELQMGHTKCKWCLEKIPLPPPSGLSQIQTSPSRGSPTHQDPTGSLWRCNPPIMVQTGSPTHITMEFRVEPQDKIGIRTEWNFKFNRKEVGGEWGEHNLFRAINQAIKRGEENWSIRKDLSDYTSLEAEFKNGISQVVGKDKGWTFIIPKDYKAYDQRVELSWIRHAVVLYKLHFTRKSESSDPSQIEMVGSEQKVQDVPDQSPTASSEIGSVGDRKAGVPDIQQQMQMQIREMQAELQMVRAEQRKKEQEKADKEQCIICMEREKNHVMVPCGHMFCGPCTEKMFRVEDLSKRCPICRDPVVSITKVFS